MPFGVPNPEDTPPNTPDPGDEGDFPPIEVPGLEPEEPPVDPPIDDGVEH